MRKLIGLESRTTKLPKDLIPLILEFISPFKKNILILALLSIFYGTVPTIQAKIVENIINFVNEFDVINRDKFLKGILKLAIIYGFWWELINWAWRLYDYVYLKCMPKIKASVFNQFYSYIQEQDQDFFQKNLAGFTTNRIDQASRSIEMIISGLIEKVLLKISAIIAALIGLYMLSPIFATVFALWLVIFLGMSSFWTSRIKTLTTDWSISKSVISGKIVDNINNISSIRTFNNYKYERRYLGHYVNKMIKAENILQWFMLKLRYFLGLSCSFMIFGMIYFLGESRANMEISAASFGFVLWLCNEVSSLIWDFSQDLGDLFEEIGSFNQSLSILMSQSNQDKTDAIDIKIKNGKIEFRNVTFSYLYNDHLFKNKNLIINGGSKIGLVGFSGSGKTTFINLISRTYNIQNGKILIDDIDISEVSQKSIRNQISVIPQEPILFNRTILENIRYGDLNSSFEEILEAAKKAFIHDEIMKLNDGYNTLCGERGSLLSGGQRQRIIIARAILKNAPILILDEATSALDSLTQELVHHSLENLMIGKTVLIIAHRLSTLKNVDRILVFDKGSIVQDGKHEELINKGGLYLELWNSQIGGFISSTPINNIDL